MAHPAQFTDKEWNKWVKRGRALVRSQTGIQFDLGDITLDMFPKQRPGSSKGVELALAEFAGQIGISADRLQQYRHTAIAWPVEKRNPDVSFAIHEILSAMGPRARYRKIYDPPVDPVSSERRWTVNEALRAVGRSPNHPVTQQERVDRVRDLVADDEDALLATKDILQRPTVVRELMNDPSVRHIIRKADRDRLDTEEYFSDELVDEWVSHGSDAHSTIATEEYETRSTAEYASSSRPITPSRPAGRGGSSGGSLLSPSREVLEVLGACTAFYTQMQRMIPKLHVGEFTDDQREAMTNSLNRVKAASEWAETVIRTGDTTMDQALAKLLGGASE